MSADQFVVNVEGAVHRDDQWLMIIRSSQEAHAGGTLSMVGGTVNAADPSEDVLERALRRELLEEVGVEVGDLLRYVESKSFYSDSGRWVIDIVFLAAYLSGEPTVIDPAEVESVRWMTFDEIATHPRTPQWIMQSMTLADKIRTAGS